jgi:predicted hydrocarbon binding protein
MKHFVTQNMGEGKWEELLEKAGLKGKLYMAHSEAPDEEVVAIVETASALTGQPVSDILTAFGEFLVPYLTETFNFLIKPGWTALDLIENTEESIHKVIRVKDPTAKPPALKCERTGDDEVKIIYTSPRKMCAVAKGISRGLGTHFNEALSIVENRCMHEGASECEIVVKKVS